MYKGTLQKCKENDEHVWEYQSQELKQFLPAKAFLESHYKEYCSKVCACVTSRLAWSDLALMRDIIFVLSTSGWEKVIEEENDLQAVDRLVERFSVPLEGAGAELHKIHAEFAEIIEYGAQYFSLSTMDYKSVWWRVFKSSNTSEWTNALLLVRLLFSLPASNGKLERVFSTVNVIKVDRRARLTNESLDDLLTINIDKTPLTSFDSNPAIDLWWKEKNRLPNQKPRKRYRPRKLRKITSTESDTATSSTVSIESSDSELSSDEEPDLLTKWDMYMNSDESD